MFTREDMLREIDRELSMRANVYPSQVERGKIKQGVADKRVAILIAVRGVIERAPDILLRREPPAIPPSAPTLEQYEASR